MLNLAIMASWVGAARAAGYFALGALAWIAPMGFVHYPGTSDLVSALCFFGSLGYSAGVGLVVHGRNQHLRRARDELREGARRYQLITEHAAELVAMVDRDGRLRYASPSYSRILDDEDLAPGADAFRRLHEEDQLRVRGALQSLVKSGLSCRLHLRLHTRYGELRRYEILVHAVRDNSGAVTEAEAAITGAVLVSRDVTDATLREEQLEVAAHAFERMAEAIVITSADGRILTVNKAYTQITGYAAAEVVGQPEADFRSAMQPAEFYDDLYAEVMKTGNWSGMTWSRRRDGSLYREWRSVSVVRDSQGAPTHYVALFRELNGHGADARSA
jgi:PAS domain S-box-containing protein